MSTLVIAEHDNSSLKNSVLNTITAAAAIGDAVDVLIAGADCKSAADEAASMKGVRKVILADSPAYLNQLPEALAPLVVAESGDYSHLFAAATTAGKNLMPRVAALLDVGQISDIVEVKSTDTFVRPIYAGNAMATVQSFDPTKVVTVRTTAFAEAAKGGSADVSVSNHVTDQTMAQFLGEQLSVSERPELTAASIIVSGGRGMQDGANFALLEKVADKLGAAIGASRAAVDAGFVPNDYQVGQTGKIVAPDLYIAVGISGAIQHLAGMKDSKVIVAVNKDEEAPIFQVADFGLVADLFEALPELEKAL
ncbi:MAG: electron transfer flavoprotein subunit alpha [Gammaproteobacteria bacterium]|nr:electron transfer flavoprotein subunit alpha [Gammaproteobacteria bacterium]HBW83870.1 electron transfer flavoprotein subunit alpha [Gammaproteobacteria bacterium]|tara:strand:- start:3962 stop:4888 length:927 start_codon:yes stop_codon:yes gene_type:complete